MLALALEEVMLALALDTEEVVEIDEGEELVVLIDEEDDVTTLELDGADEVVLMLLALERDVVVAEALELTGTERELVSEGDGRLAMTVVASGVHV